MRPVREGRYKVCMVVTISPSQESIVLTLYTGRSTLYYDCVCPVRIVYVGKVRQRPSIQQGYMLAFVENFKIRVTLNIPLFISYRWA